MEEKLNEWVPGLDEYNPGITKEKIANNEIKQ